MFSCSESPKTEEKTGSQTAPSATEAKAYEFGDDKLVEILKKGSASLESGDIDGWLVSFADNAVYHWNNYDSLAGKAAISDYWKKRRADVIDSMSFTKQIWMPIKLNKPMVEDQLTGNYVLCWQVTYARYKTGKSMKQRIHMVYHFDANDKIDRVSQYLDRAPINAAMTQ